MKASQVAYLVILIIILLTIIFFLIDRLLASIQSRSNKHLSKKGKRVVAIVTDIHQEVEQRGPPEFPHINYCYYIQAEWTDIHTGRTYTFKSKRLNSKPKEVPGEVLPVLLDTEKPSHYHMELSEDHV